MHCEFNHPVKYIHNMLVQHDMHERRADYHFSQWGQSQSEATSESLFFFDLTVFFYYLILNKLNNTRKVFCEIAEF